MRFATEYGFYELNPFPGCNQIVVKNHSFVYENFRGLGHGTNQHKIANTMVKNLGYNYMLCTVKYENEPQKRILINNHWKLLDVFYNRETRNQVEIYGKLVE